MLPLNLYARVRVFKCAIAHETAGAARTRSSLRPLFSKGANEDAGLGQNMPRERETVSPVIASAAKQSIYPRAETRIALLRSQ